MPDGVQLLKMDRISSLRAFYDNDRFRLCTVVKNDSQSECEIWGGEISSSDATRLVSILSNLYDSHNWPMYVYGDLEEVLKIYRGKIDPIDIEFIFNCVFQSAPIFSSCRHINKIFVVPIPEMLEIFSTR